MVSCSPIDEKVNKNTTVKLYSVAFVYDSTELKEENIELYKETFNKTLNTKVSISYFESNLDDLMNTIKDINSQRFDIIIIGSNSLEYNKQVINYSNKNTIIFSPTEFENLSKSNTIIFGLSHFASIKTLVNYYLYFQNYTRFFVLFHEESEIEEISTKIQIFLKNTPRIRFKIFNYNLNTLNRYFKNISHSIDKYIEDINQNKTLIIIVGPKKHFNEIFSIASMFGLDKKSTITGTYNSDIQFDNNFPIIFSSINSLVQTHDKTYYMFNDDEYNKFVFEDISLVINNVLLNLNKTISPIYFVEEFSNILNSQTFDLNLGKTQFKKSVAIRKYSIIKKIENEYQIIW